MSISISNSDQFPYARNNQSANLPSRLGAKATSDNPTPQTPWASIAIVSVAFIALGLTGYLSWAALTSSKVAGCGGGAVFDCTHVLQSKWSTVFGVPVALPAMGLYSAVLGAMAVSGRAKRRTVQELATGLVALFSLTAAFAAVWYVMLQVFVVEHLCGYCLAAHACGLVLAALAVCNVSLTKAKLTWISIVGLVSVLVLATAQSLAKEPKRYQVEHLSAAVSRSDDVDESVDKPAVIANVATKPMASQQAVASKQLLSANEEARVIAINGGIKLDVTEWPLIGDANAEHVVVEMFDYTCPHCRENHQHVALALKQLGEEKFAVLALSVPMNDTCNNTVRVTSQHHMEACELAKLSIAVWRVNPQKFPEFHDWLFSGQTPTAEAAIERARSLVDKDKLHAELDDKVVAKYLAKQIELYKSLGAGTVPKLILADRVISGKLNSASDLVRIVDRQ